MGVEYTKAPEVEVLANAMIESFHEHLKKANISYVYVDQARHMSDGRTILGQAAKRNKLDKLLSERKEDFVVIISKDRWEKMTEEERRALVDHELCHCGIMVDANGKEKFVLRGHPIEEFPENLKRFEFRRLRLGDLIEHPPSPISAGKPERQIEPATEGENSTTP